MKKRGQSNPNTKKKTIITPKEEKEEKPSLGEKEKERREVIGTSQGGFPPHPPLWHHHQPLTQPQIKPRLNRQRCAPLPVLAEEEREGVVEGVYSDLLTEILEEVCLEVHKRVKTGNFCLECGVDNFSPSLTPVAPGRDIFGEVLKGSSSMEVLQCPNCNRPVTSVRFVPHLEKCLGLGRTSSRLATRRIAAMRVDPGRGMEDNDRRKRKRQRGFEETTTSRRARRAKEENDEDYEELDGEDDLDDLDDSNQGDEPYAPPMKRNKTRPTRYG